jgi:hypothetical protein
MMIANLLEYAIHGFDGKAREFHVGTPGGKGTLKYARCFVSGQKNAETVQNAQLSFCEKKR